MQPLPQSSEPSQPAAELPAPPAPTVQAPTVQAPQVPAPQVPAPAAPPKSAVPKTAAEAQPPTANKDLYEYAELLVRDVARVYTLATTGTSKKTQYRPLVVDGVKRLFEVACLVEGGGPKAQSCVADQQQHQFDDVAKVIQAASSKEEGVWALFYMLRHKIKVGDSEMSLIAEVPAVPQKSSSGLPLSMAKNAEAIFPDDDDSQDAPASPKEEEQPSMAEAPATQAASPKKQPSGIAAQTNRVQSVIRSLVGNELWAEQHHTAAATDLPLVRVRPQVAT